MKVGFTSGGSNDARCFAWTRQKLIWILSRGEASKSSKLYSLGIKYIAGVHNQLVHKMAGSRSIVAYMHDLKSGRPIYFGRPKSGGWDKCMTAWKGEVAASKEESPKVVRLVLAQCSEPMKDRLLTVATYANETALLVS